MHLRISDPVSQRPTLLLFSPPTLGLLLQPLRMGVDHLRELLHNIVECVVVPAREVVLANLLVERGQTQQGHNVGVRILDGNVERLVAGVVDKMVVGPMVTAPTRLTGHPATWAGTS